MANRFASLDPTWAHLPEPAPSPWPHPHAAWLSPAAAFESDALTSALRASMSPGCAAAAASSSSPTPSSSTTTSASELAAPCAPSPSQGRARTRPGATGRVSKRKPRASRKAQATYISADPANFRRMVQEVTGFPVPGADLAAASPPEPRPAAAARTCVIPTLDTSAFLFDSAPAPASLPAPRLEEDRASSGAAATTMEVGAETEADESSLLLELEAMVGAPAGVSAFPTLESWEMF